MKPASPLTDNSPMPFGKHKGQALANVPASHLLWLYTQREFSHAALKEYIADNLDVLHTQAQAEKLESKED